MDLKMCPTCKHPFMAEKLVCPQCPAPFVWNRKSWKNFAFLMSVTVVPLLALLFLVLYFFFRSFFVQ